MWPKPDPPGKGGRMCHIHGLEFVRPAHARAARRTFLAVSSAPPGSLKENEQHQTEDDAIDGEPVEGVVLDEAEEPLDDDEGGDGGGEESE